MLYATLNVSVPELTDRLSEFEREELLEKYFEIDELMLALYRKTGTSLKEEVENFINNHESKFNR